MRRRMLTVGVCAVLLVGGTGSAAPAASAQDPANVVGTWRGGAYEVASPLIYGRADITLTITPDRRWTSVWRQAGREKRDVGTWRLESDRIVFEVDSRQPVPPTLSLRHRGDVAYGTALVALPEGRATVVAITLTRD
jgi:hypothetical protein